MLPAVLIPLQFTNDQGMEAPHGDACAEPTTSHGY